MALEDTRKTWWGALRPLLLASGLALGLAACGDTSETPSEDGSSTDAATTEAGDDYVIYHRGNFAEPSSLDPHRISGTWESHIGRDLFLGLMTDNAGGEAVFGAAESFETAPDGLSWTFTIREGHTWSDGTPVTAHDFVYAYQRILNPLTGAEYAAILYPIKNANPVNFGEVPVEELGVRAVDDRTLEIQLEYPAPFLPEMLTHQALFPVPKHLLESVGSDWVRAGTMVSNGPYTLAEWRPNDYVRLVKNPLFYDAENVAIDEVRYYPTDNTPAALRRFRAGELDSNNDFPIQQYDWLRENLPDETRVHPYIATNYVIFNTEREPFTNRDIRMAMAMAIDRTIIARDIMRTGQEPAYALVPPGIRNYPRSAQMAFAELTMEERKVEALNLMRGAGYGDMDGDGTCDTPLEIVYRHREGTDNRRRAVAVAAMWKEICVEAQLINTEVKTHYQDLRTGNFLVGDAGWVADYNDAKNYLFLLESETGQLNYGNYNNPEYDALLAQADQTLDIEARGDLLSQAEQIMLNDAPLIPVLFDTSRNLVGQHVEGFVDNPNDYHPTRYMRINEEKRARR